MSPCDFPIGEMYVLKVGKTSHGKILAVVHVILYLNYRRVCQNRCEVKLLLACG